MACERYGACARRDRDDLQERAAESTWKSSSAPGSSSALLIDKDQPSTIARSIGPLADRAIGDVDLPAPHVARRRHGRCPLRSVRADHLTHEPVAAARVRLEKPTIGGQERSPGEAHGPLERGVRHDRVGPEHAQELVLRHDPFAVTDEVREHGEDLRLERSDLTCDAQLPARHVEQVRSESPLHRDPAVPCSRAGAGALARRGGD